MYCNSFAMSDIPVFNGLRSDTVNSKNILYQQPEQTRTLSVYREQTVGEASDVSMKKVHVL